MKNVDVYEKDLLTAVENAVYDHLEILETGDIYDGEDFVYGFLWDAIKSDIILERLGQWGTFTPSEISKARESLQDFVAREFSVLEDLEANEGNRIQREPGQIQEGNGQKELIAKACEQQMEINKRLEGMKAQLDEAADKLIVAEKLVNDYSSQKSYLEKLGRAFLEVSREYSLDGQLGGSLLDVNKLVLAKLGAKRVSTK